MNKSIIITALAALMGISATVEARTPVDLRRKAAEDAAFKWAPKHEADNNWKVISSRPSKSVAKALETVTTPDVSWNGADDYTYIEMPDGEIWYAATTIRKEAVSQSEYYTEYAYTGIEIKIYDTDFNQTAYINSPINVPDGFERCTSIQVAANVTQKFFNFDNNYEVMVMCTFKPADGYGAIPFTDVFSLNGPDTPAEKIATLPGYYTSAVNASTSKWSEDYYMVFFSGETYTDTEMLYTFDVYTKASYSKPEATVIKSFTIDMMKIMADGENETLPVILNAHDGEAYVAVSQYEKTFFEDPFDWYNDNLTPDNNYIIDLYKTSGWSPKELNLVSTTKIACESPAEPYMMRSYCLGRFRLDGDISFDFGTGDDPAFILTINDADMRDNSESYFAVYNVAGNVMTTFGENSDALMLLSDVPGYPQQYCFVQPDASGNYQFNMVNYPELDLAASLPIAITEDNQLYGLSFTLDRVPGQGSYGYAVAAQQGDETADGDTFHPVLWFDRNGVFSHIDRVMGGKDVAMMSPYIMANGLTPYVFNTDVKREYMAFVLRSTNHGAEKSVYDLIVVNEDGENNLCYQFPVDATGINAALVNTATNPAIWVTYRIAGSDEFTSDFIKLPLNKWEGEGTAENPYIIHTAGDFGLIKNNLAAHYLVADDIDFDGTTLEGFSGIFTGSLDGAGHTLSNFTLSGSPVFSTVGQVDADKAVIKNLTFSHVTVDNAPAVLAGSVYTTSIENVYVYDLNANITGDMEFGGLVNGARFSTEIKGCAVMGTINAPEAAGVGGVAYLLSNSAIEASVFDGEITAGSEAGGIVAEIADDKSTVTDCHVKASITAKHTIGGIAATSGRGLISDCLVEGAITATEAHNAYSYYNDGFVKEINTGGIVGSLQRPTADFETGETNAGVAVTKNVVALESITIPESDELYATAHRIVGRTSINDDPAIVSEKYNPATGDWDTTWGDRLAEEGITDNYALAPLAVVDPALEAGLNTVEGESLEAGKADTEFFEGLGFKFNGYSASEPWVSGASLPALYFENTVGASISFDPAAISIVEGQKEYVMLMLEKVEFDALTIESTDESGCYITPVELDEDGNVVCEVVCLKTGSYVITATNGTVSGTLTVTGTSGIASVAGDTKAAISYDGSAVNAPACDITVYSVTGIEVARGRNHVSTTSLQPGIYVATASGAEALKFVVR
ncbi:MAG: hypothetical protein K2L14_09530 [Duncaniella sp.]|nr:hypothetical protein [Duncaniella sp.]